MSACTLHVPLFAGRRELRDAELAASAARRASMQSVSLFPSETPGVRGSGATKPRTRLLARLAGLRRSLACDEAELAGTAGESRSVLAFPVPAAVLHPTHANRPSYPVLRPQGGPRAARALGFGVSRRLCFKLWRIRLPARTCKPAARLPAGSKRLRSMQDIQREQGGHATAAPAPAKRWTRCLQPPRGAS